MRKHFLRAGVLVVSVLSSACGEKKEIPAARPEMPPPAPLVVQVTAATAEKPSPPLNAIAKLEGSSVTEVKAPTGGFLIRQNYKEGAEVKPGEVLFELDSRPFQENGTAKEGRLKIVAPVEGVAGRAGPGLGDLIKPGATLTTISTVDPIKAVFEVPAGHFVAEPSPNSEASGFLKKSFKFKMAMPDGSLYSEEGNSTGMAEPKTGGAKGVTLAALFPNPKHLLILGDYVKINEVPDKTENVVRIPASSLGTTKGDGQVMVIKSDNTVEFREVKVSERQGGMEGWGLVSGLQPGERVVIDGARKLPAGERVTPQLESPANP